MDIHQTVNILTEKAGVVSQKNFNCYYELLIKYSDWSEKTILGDKYICRFCGQTDSKKFKTEAHTFPEFTGNKWLFSNDECDQCNSNFSKYENELANHGLLTRAIYGMKTKKKPNTKIKNNFLSVEKINNGLVVNLNSRKGEIPDSDKDGDVSFNFDFTNNIRKADLKIPEREYIPLYLFKALNKIAFSIMPENELENKFDHFKLWLNNVNDELEDDKFKAYFLTFHNRLPFKGMHSPKPCQNPFLWHLLCSSRKINLIFLEAEVLRFG